MNKLWLIHTAWKLGAINCLRVAAYKARVRHGVYRKHLPIRPLAPFGSALRGTDPRSPQLELADQEALLGKTHRIVAGELEYFGAHWWRVGTPPDWFLDPWTGQRWPADLHWSQTDEFGTLGLDIKAVWEPSRFEWAVLLARAYSVTSSRDLLDTLCSWLDSWVDQNPVNAGPNWKCGQETAIRLLRLLEALHHIACSQAALSAVAPFVVAHLDRIFATLSYAIGQDNNHGTSEAAALFVGGHWLTTLRANPEMAGFGERMAIVGERQLVERVNRLVAQDGTFAQYSVNYHRMFLDTMCFVEAWSRRLSIPSPLKSCEQRMRAACDWLYAMVDPATGDAPNLGGNDGALLLISPATVFRDHRPTLQLAYCLFASTRAYPLGPWDDACRAWGIEPSSFVHRERRARSMVFMPGGFVSIVGAECRSRAVLRVPSFKFRPSQADALHFDLWVGSENVLRDAGTYSYNADGVTYEYFSGVQGHSTCQFDEREQMPRLSRFLFARWLKCDEKPTIETVGTESTVAAAYTDFTGCRHRRKISVSGTRWVVLDELSGFSKQAVIRWRLHTDDWAMSEEGVIGRIVRIDIKGESDLKMQLVQGWESRSYLERRPVPVLEIVIRPPGGLLQTTIAML